MKKILALTFVMIFALCGCGKKQADQPQGDAQTQTQTQSVEVPDAEIVTADKKLGEYAGTFISKYVAGGKFYIKETAVASDGNEVVELAYDGSKTASKSGNISQIIDGDMLYIVMHDEKAILTSPVSSVMATNMISSLGIKSEQEAEQNLLKTGKEDVNGAEYSYEEYKNGEGTIKYYFDAKTLRYIKHTSSDGTTSLYAINAISTDIPADFFTVPADYTTQELNSLQTQEN